VKKTVYHLPGHLICKPIEIIQNIKAIMLHHASLPQDKKSVVSKLNPFVCIYSVVLWRTSTSILSDLSYRPDWAM